MLLSNPDSDATYIAVNEVYAQKKESIKTTTTRIQWVHKKVQDSDNRRLI
jgi:hypothetical protein